ncbi:MAG: site-specific DNA-methyltransferase, partial [Candidatus Jacksonbacteria bacterium]|nr:site-specific DNA-methyltransferase [Candidatus Jacksonbacteria bacterium]
NDFVYKDNFKDNIKNYKEITGQVDGEGRNLSNNPETSGRYHTDWLNMIYSRLKLARNLLQDDGVIFISIDDNEVMNLKKMCDEIFGEENCVGTVSWKNKYGAGAKTKGFIEVHEYILCYSKVEFKNIESVLSEDQIKVYDKNKDSKYESRGGFVTQPLMTNSLDDRENLQYSIEFNGEVIPPRKQWVWSKERLLEAIANDEVVFKKKNNGEYSVRAKVYLKDEGGRIRKGKPLSLLNGPFNQEGTKEVDDLLGPNVFSFPKPSALIKHFFGFTLNDEEDSSGVYLDFFAGSCASAQAVFELNKEDNGNRKIIMVQLPELIDNSDKKKKENKNTIKFLNENGLPVNLAEVSKERIRRAAAKIKEEKPEYEGDLGFKVFKLDSTNIKPWEVDFDLTERTLEDYISNIKSDRREEDVLYEILLKYGLDLTLPISERSIAGQKVFDIGMGALIICLADAISLEVVEGMAKLKEELNPEIMRVVFKDSGFKDDVVKTNAVQILKQAGIVDVRSL